MLWFKETSNLVTISFFGGGRKGWRCYSYDGKAFSKEETEAQSYDVIYPRSSGESGAKEPSSKQSWDQNSGFPKSCSQDTEGSAREELSTS